MFSQTANLFNLEVDLIFYDPTTASFSVDYEDDLRALESLVTPKERFWAP